MPEMPCHTRPWKRLNVSRAQGLVYGDLRVWGSQTKAVATSRQSFCFWLVPHMVLEILFLKSTLPKAVVVLVVAFEGFVSEEGDVSGRAK